MKTRDEGVPAEKKILSAAKGVFVKKGLKNAAMADIAAEAGISRTSLNYYFRTKEKLFDAVFKEILAEFLPKVGGILGMKIPFKKKIFMIIDAHCDVLLKNAGLPVFVIMQLNSTPKKFMASLRESLAKNAAVAELVAQLRKEYGLSESEFVRLFSLYSGLMIMPFLIRDVLTPMWKGGFEDFILSRKKMVASAIINFLENR